jgi:hypothetical protein
MNKVAYYHTYLTDNPSVWSSITMEQFKVMEDSRLLDDLDVMNITAISQDDRRMEQFVRLCETYGFNKLNIMFIRNTHPNDHSMLSGRESNGPSVTEIPTFKRMWNECQDNDCKVLYFHSKAMTAFDKFFSSQNLDVSKFKQNVYWRHYLNWGVLERWRECIKALDKHDMAGVNYREDPISHYSGSFWWANSSHIKRLPDPETIEWWNKVQLETVDPWLKTCPIRYKDEHWATHLKDTKMFNIEGAKDNPAFVTTRRSIYA